MQPAFAPREMLQRTMGSEKTIILTLFLLEKCAKPTVETSLKV
jgi:hypothetical protein